MLNRLDRLTAANYGMPINTNFCKNMFVKPKDKTIMLQAASIYTMLDVAETSLQMLGSDLFMQLTNN